MRISIKLISAAVLAIPALAAAKSESITFDGTGHGGGVYINYDHQVLDAFAGQMYFNYGVKKSSSDFLTYCVDLSHWINTGETYQVTPIQTPTLSNGNVYRLAGDVFDAGISTATDNNHAEALQLAIWKTVYGNQVSFSGVSKTITSEENSYLAAGAKYNGAALYLQNAPGCSGQSQITTTPEPASMAVLGIGAFGVFFRRRRS